jgi:flagellar basal body rod protein FlgC
MGLFDDYFQTGANQGNPQVPVYDRTGQSAVSMTQRPVGYIMNPDIASPIPAPTRTQISPSQTQSSMPNLRVAGLPVSQPVQALAKYNQQMQQQRQAQTTPQSSMLAKIRSGLGASPTSPMGMALDSAAQSLLQQSGYSPVPRTTGQIFGEALGAAREGYMGGKALEQAEAERQRSAEIEDRLYNLKQLEFGLEMQKAGETDPPKLETIYDEKTGQPYKAMYDPDNPNANSQGYVRVGGAKVGEKGVIVRDTAGNIIFQSGDVSDIGKSTKTETEKALLKSNQALSSMTQVMNSFKPEYFQTGNQLSAYFTSNAARLGIPVSKARQQYLTDQARFFTQVQSRFSNVISELAGAAVSAQELKRIESFVLNKDDDPYTAQAKLRDTIGSLLSIQQRNKDILSGKAKITDDLYLDYPISITNQNGDTLYMHEYVEYFLEDNEGATRDDAYEAYKQDARKMSGSV